MFIIFGSTRSGTTLLVTSLEQNDNIVIPYETDFIVPLSFIIDRVQAPLIGKRLAADFITSAKLFDNSIGKYISKKEVNDAINDSQYSLPHLLSAIYNRIALNSGKSIAGDKTPNDLSYITPLAKADLFNGNIKIIHMVRDIRGVVLSLKKTYFAPLYAESEFPSEWNRTNLQLNNLMHSNKDSYLLVRYEDLITSPAEHLRKITDFLGIPFQDKMLSHEKRGAKYTAWDWHNNLNQPFIKEKATEWEKELRPDIINLCKIQAFEALKRFGYITGKEHNINYRPELKDEHLIKDLQQRNEKILALRKKIKELELLENRVIELQGEVAKLGKWGTELDQENKQKGGRIIELQNEVEELGGWGRRLDKEAKQKDADISLLKKKLKLE